MAERRGESAGAKPANDATYLYGGLSYGGFRAVPVLPATSYPAIWAFVPVPLATTSFSIERIVAAVCGDTTCRDSGAGWSRRTPSLSSDAATRRGGRLAPPLAIVVYTSS